MHDSFLSLLSCCCIILVYLYLGTDGTYNPRSAESEIAGNSMAVGRVVVCMVGMDVISLDR